MRSIESSEQKPFSCERHEIMCRAFELRSYFIDFILNNVEHENKGQHTSRGPSRWVNDLGIILGEDVKADKVIKIDDNTTIVLSLNLDTIRSDGREEYTIFCIKRDSETDTPNVFAIKSFYSQDRVAHSKDGKNVYKTFTNNDDGWIRFYFVGDDREVSRVCDAGGKIATISQNPKEEYISLILNCRDRCKNLIDHVRPQVFRCYELDTCRSNKPGRGNVMTNALRPEECKRRHPELPKQKEIEFKFEKRFIPKDSPQHDSRYIDPDPILHVDGSDTQLIKAIEVMEHVKEMLQISEGKRSEDETIRTDCEDTLSEVDSAFDKALM